MSPKDPDVRRLRVPCWLPDVVTVFGCKLRFTGKRKSGNILFLEHCTYPLPPRPTSATLEECAVLVDSLSTSLCHSSRSMKFGLRTNGTVEIGTGGSGFLAITTSVVSLRLVTYQVMDGSDFGIVRCIEHCASHEYAHNGPACRCPCWTDGCLVKILSRRGTSIQPLASLSALAKTVAL